MCESRLYPSYFRLVLEPFSVIVISMMWFTYVGGTGIADGVDGEGVRQGDFKGGG